MRSRVSRRPFKSLFRFALLLGTLALAFASQPSATARPCCSSCPQDDFEHPCWNVCAFSC